MRKNLLLTISILCLAVFGLRAQGITSSSMDGKVTDQKGGELPGANVVATHVPSGTEYGISSRSDGRFNLNGLRVGGPYTVRVSFVGYKDQTRENIFLELGQTFRIDFKLVDESTELQEIVVSAAQDPLLNSEKIGASSNFGVGQIQRLPSIGRDLRDFSALTPQAGGNFSFGGRSNLYNNLTIDGATVNNVFGLSPLPAGQSNTTSFSIDAIQEITVSLSPYDLRQGNFTGAGVSAVTRSGSNDLSGSAYYFFRNEGLAGKKVEGTEIPLTGFDYKNYGFRLGGPIIKNKLFFFVNAEFENRNDPAYANPVRANKAASSVGTTQATDDIDPETGLKGLQDFLINKVGYDPGTYKDNTLATASQRYVVRFDYNINANHKLTLRGNSTLAYRDQLPNGSGGFRGAPIGGRGNSNNFLPFSSSFFRQNNNQYSVTTELTSTFGGGKFSNNLIAGVNIFRDFREKAGGGEVVNAPLVDILGPNGNNMTSFGLDPFTPNNKLSQDVYQLNDFFSIYLKDHTVTVGTANELYTFYNRFTQVINGNYRYNSLAEFYQDADPATTANARPANYNIQYVSVNGGPDATAVKWSALQLGGFIQDEYSGIKNLKLIGGLRVDVPLYLTDLPQSPYYNSIDFGGEKLRVGGQPKVTPLFSPRVGVNWDVKGDRTTQVRGGTGILTGRVPFVWLSNAVSNNGLFFGTFDNSAVPLTNTGDGVPYDFSLTPYLAPSSAYSNLSTGNPALITNPLDRNAGRPVGVPNINAVAEDFKFPQVWRSNIAVDQKLPYGLVGTLEFIYTKDINAVYYKDINLAPAKASLAGDGRPLYGAAPASVTADRAIVSNDRRLNGDVGQALVLSNTNKGYQWSITAQLQKTFNRNFQVSAAYTYTDSKELNPQSGSTAGGTFNSQVNIAGPNNPGLSYAGTLTPHRVIAYGTYRVEYLKHLATTFGFTYEGRSGNNFSYTYNGDVNSDGNPANDLIYIPRSKEEILLAPTNANDTRSTDKIWEQLDSYISQDSYLSERRGKYAERSGTYAPWVNRLNLSVLQDFYIDVKGKRNTIQLSLNVENALNLISSDLGLTKTPARTSLIRFLGYEQPQTAGTVGAPTYGSAGIPPALVGQPFAPTTGRPVYGFDVNADTTPFSSTYINNTTIGARWQIQFGVRYIF
jgi:hypothetical protein